MDGVLGFASLVALIGGAIEVVKRAGWLPQKYAGVGALGLGAGVGIALALAEATTPAQAVATGIAAGLTAAGTYSATKAARGR